jgi:uncharacterized protein (TIGR02453 family)
MKISKKTLDFLKELSVNNNRDWFEANKAIFKSHQSEVKAVLERVKEGLSETDIIEKLKMFRIYRDVRFSKDKTPYKDYFSGSLSRMGQSLRGGYYIHLKPGDAFLAVGFWDPNKEDLFRIRKEIETDARDFHELLNNKSFKNIWGNFQGDTLKTAPKGFSKEHPEIGLLRRKNFVFIHPLKDSDICSENFIPNTIKAFEVSRPFLDLMSDILTTDLNGEPLL